MTNRKPLQMIVFAVLATGASLLAAQSDARAQRPRDRQSPVSWVNPDLPDGAGLTHHVLASQALGHEVGYVVCTPPGFDASRDTRYPVIYFLHGLGGNETSDSAGFSSLIARGIRDSSVPPVICVFPNGGRSGYRGSVETMIAQELIPLIDKSYPTKAEAKSRAVAGFSMGGAGAVRLSILHPELFCAAGSWGGGMWRGADAILAAAEEGADTLRGHKYAALLVNGDQDRPDAFEALARKLSDLKILHEVVVVQETPHNLGLYYERAGERMTAFLGQQLRN